jgi:hypothetical protein
VKEELNYEKGEREAQLQNITTEFQEKNAKVQEELNHEKAEREKLQAELQNITRELQSENTALGITARPAAHIYGNDQGRHSDGHVFQWFNGYSEEFIDDGMNYTNGSIIVPKPGLYYIYVQVNCDPDQNSWCGYSIRVNGNTVTEHHVDQTSSGLDVLNGQTSESGLLRKLNAGDRLSVTARNTGFFHIRYNQSFFGAVWLSSVSL